MRPLIFWLCIVLFIFSCKKNSTDPPALDPLPPSIGTTILPANFTDVLQSVCFVSPSIGFVSGYAGGIYKTVDSGKTWTTENSTVTSPVLGLFFLDEQKGFAVGGQMSCDGAGCTPPGAYVLATTNGGQTWTRVYTPAENTVLSSICFVDALTGFAAGNNLIIKTTDGGQTWSEYKIDDLGGQLMQVYFTDAKKGYVVGLNDRIAETADAGVSWDVTTTHRNIGYYSISAAEGSIYVGGQGTMIKSTNQGGSWRELPNSPSDIFAVHFMDGKKGFAFGRGNYTGGDFGYYYGSIYYTSDGGDTWGGTNNVQVMGLILAASFPTNNIGYAIGARQVIRVRAN